MLVTSTGTLTMGKLLAGIGGMPGAVEDGLNLLFADGGRSKDGRCSVAQNLAVPEYDAFATASGDWVSQQHLRQ
jgi:hypothetical protein